jgi:GNAT superfamily N-acetyltransferase
MLHTIVAPASQGRGIGKVLAATALREVMKHRPLSLSVLINGDSLRSARFANACGFALAMEWDYSRLDLARFAAQDFGKWEKRLQREGYEFLPFTELPDMAERIAELHSLYCQVRRAAPSGEERRLPDAKDFTDAYTQQPQLFERYLVGLRRGRLTGLATLENQPHTDSELYNEITGVHPACYHRGVIMGLITCAARWARERGFAFINAENVVTNKNIIPVMRRIGFQRISRWQLFRKEF